MSSSHSDTGFFCSVCDILTLQATDYVSKTSTGACRECELVFFQPNRKKWEAGWRPSTEEVDNYRKESRKRVYSILSEINNYI